MVRNPDHPTRERLIDATVQMLDSRDIDQLNVNEVLETSGISKGSMYHHFEDFNGLINAALVRRFTRGVDADIAQLSQLLVAKRTPAEFFSAIEEVTTQVHTLERRDRRAERAAVFSRAHQQEALRAALAREQYRLTTVLADIIRGAQERGWVVAEVDPVAFATFLQAFTLGQIVNDILVESLEGNSMDYGAWHTLVHRVITSVRT